MYRPYSSPAADAHSLRSVDSQLRELTKDFAMSFNTGNFDQAAAQFSHDGVLMAPFREAASGQKEIERSLRQLGDAGYCDLRLETTRVEHSGDMAMELGQFTLLRRKPDGATLPEHGNYVRVWRRLGAWLIIADCWTRTAYAATEQAA
jgi:ketosteroid isomerase-like protein